MTRLYLQASGSHLIVGIEGKPDHILHEFYSFKMHGAATQAHYLSSNFLYFWTTYPQLLEAFAKKLEAQVYNEVGMEFDSKKINSKFILAAKHQIDNLTKEQFLKQTIITTEYVTPHESENPNIRETGLRSSMPPITET